MFANMTFHLDPAPPRYQASRAVLLVLLGIAMTDSDRSYRIDSILSKWDRRFNQEFLKILDGRAGGWLVGK